MQEWVTRLRAHAKWTQVDLAYHLRVSPATIARWESGKVQPHALTRDALTRLAKKQKFPEPMPD